MDFDLLTFFDGHLSALPLFEALEALLREEFPEAGRRVQKTQITYFQRHVFACVSFARVKRKSELPEPWLVLSLGLPEPLRSPRAAVNAEIRPGRWTVHLVLSTEAELDEELRGWLRQSFALSQRPRTR